VLLPLGPTTRYGHGGGMTANCERLAGSHLPLWHRCTRLRVGYRQRTCAA